MILYAEIKNVCKTDTIDYFNCTLPGGKEILIDWSSSSYGYDEGRLFARCKEIFFTDLGSEDQKEEYADGQLEKLTGVSLDMFECKLNENDEAPDDMEEVVIISLTFIETNGDGSMNRLHIEKGKSELQFNIPYNEIKETQDEK